MIKKSHGIRNKDMQDAILPLKTKKASLPSTATILTFTIFGWHDDLVDEYGNKYDKGYPLLYNIKENNDTITQAESLPKACAKMVHGTTKVRYFIKQNSYGRFYNPLGLYEENNLTKKFKYIGKAEWKYCEVNRQTFIKYLMFLKTKNQARLTDAERENF